MWTSDTMPLPSVQFTGNNTSDTSRYLARTQQTARTRLGGKAPRRMDANSVHQHAASAAGDDHPYAQASYEASYASYAHYFSSSEEEFDSDFVAEVEATMVKEEAKVNPNLIPAKALV